MNTELISLGLERVTSLADQILSAHLKLESYRPEPLSTNERHNLGIQITSAVSEQQRWTRAIIEHLEEATNG